MDIDIPHHIRATDEELLHTHVRARVTPAGLEQLAYELAIPKTWGSAAEFGPTLSGPLETRGIGFFASANVDGAPTVAVTVTPVPYEVPIDAWARRLFECEGWTTLSASWFPGPAGLFYDITGNCIRDEIEYVRRSAVIVAGSDIVTVNCQCALDHWANAKLDFWTALITFELAARGSTRMEPWVRALVSEPSFELAHPGSWLHEPVAAHEPAVSAIDIRLPDADGETLLAYVQVRARQLNSAPLPPLAALDATTVARLDASGVTLVGSSTALTLDDEPRAVAIDGWLGGFRGLGQINGTTIEVLRGYVVRGEIVCTLLALSPLLSVDPLAALRTRRVWEIARATLVVS